MTEISCVGLGLMGSALARALLAAGHGVTVWNRSAGKAAALVELGAKEARTFAEAVAASPVVLICIDNYGSTRALLEPEGKAGHLAGRTVVSLTTGYNLNNTIIWNRLKRVRITVIHSLQTQISFS